MATAVGWLTALLSLAIAVAMVWISNAARDQLLGGRDANMVNAAETLAAELVSALGKRLQTSATPSAPSDALGALRPELAALLGQAPDRAQLDHRLRALLLDDDERVLVDDQRGDSRPRHTSPAGDPASAALGQTSPMPVVTQGEVVLQRLDSGQRQVAVRAHTDQRPALHRLGLQLRCWTVCAASATR